MKNVKKNTKMRKGISLIETILAIVIGGMLVAIVYNSFGKNKDNTEATVFFQKVTTVTSAIENSRNLNGGVYIASSENELSEESLSLILNSMGGESQTKDVSSWTYECAEGSDNTITLTTNALQSTVIRDLVIANINGNIAPWTGEAGSGNEIVMHLENVTCK